MRSMSLCMAVMFGTLLAGWSSSRAGDWPAFRGPSGNGVADAVNVPQRWSANDNIRWKIKLPRPGNGSAIIVGQQVLVTSAEDAQGHERSLIAYSLGDGKEQWRQTVRFEKTLPTHETNPYAGSTPASDGKVVVVWHASAGLHCCSLDGRPLWQRDLGEFRHIWGYGSSPIIQEGRVILQSGPGKKVFLAAYDIANGETLWEQSEPVEGDGSYTPDRRYTGAWSTPVPAVVDGKPQLIVAMPTRVIGFDPATGERLWWCAGLSHGGGDLAYSSPVVVGDMVFMTGGFGGPAMGIKLGGSGDVTDTHRLWRTEKSPQSIGTGIAYEEYVYRPNAGPGTIQCIDPGTGEEQWQSRAAGGNHWASIVLVKDLAYATNQEGATVIFRPSPENYQEVAQNELGEHTNATPAVADGCLVFRTFENLICIGK
jgi:outer membrane protein assembly factor BamB